MEWLRNGVMFERGVMGESEIFLTIREPGAEAAGQYSCFVQLTTGVTRNASAGFLIIYSKCRQDYNIAACFRSWQLHMHAALLCICMLLCMLRCYANACCAAMQMHAAAL